MTPRRFFGLLSGIALFCGACSDDEENPSSLTPQAAFSIPSNDVYKGEQVVFENLSTHATAYEWDFGDGSTSEEEEPVHTYSKCGSYGVTLIARNGEAFHKTFSTVHVTSKTIEVTTDEVSLTGKKYYASGKFYDGKTFKYEFTIKIKGSYYGYRTASRWGVQVGSTNLWWDATKDEVTTLEIKHYTNSKSSKVSCRVYAVKNGGNTSGDVFGASRTLNLTY